MTFNYMNSQPPGIPAFSWASTPVHAIRVQAGDGVVIRVLRFGSAQQPERLPVLVVGGLSTVVDSFREMLLELSQYYQVYYAETREKPSSQITENTRFDMQALALDIEACVEHLGLSHRRYLLFGYSLGATACVQAYQRLRHKPGAMVLLSPTPTFDYPWWSLPLIRLTIRQFTVLKQLAKWYLRNFHINRKEDEEMYRITSRALDTADPYKLKSTILAIAGYAVWPLLEHIDCATLVVATSKDGLHREYGIKRMAAMMPCSDYLDMETNLRTHSAEMALVIREYVCHNHEMIQENSPDNSFPAALAAG